MQPYEQKFVDIMMLYSDFCNLMSRNLNFCRYYYDILCKNIFECCFIRKISDFLPFSLLKLHFQHLIFTKIQYNEILSIIIGFLQPYDKKFVDVMMQYFAKIVLKDGSSVKSLILYRFPCKNFIFNTFYLLKLIMIKFCL